MGYAFTSVSETQLELRSVSFSYGGDTGGEADEDQIFSDFSLAIERGSRVAIMGSSGSGKSTLGRLLTGLLTPRRGWIYRHPDLELAHNVVYVDQNPLNSVFPWQRVEQNIRYPLKKLGWKSGPIEARVELLLETFQLRALRNSYPANISGGQLQRLAIARCLSWQPRFVVLDETFSALDKRTKDNILLNLPDLLEEDNTTVVLITHNAPDVFLIANRCVVLANRPVSITEDIPIVSPFRDGRPAFAPRLAGAAAFESIQHGLA